MAKLKSGRSGLENLSLVGKVAIGLIFIGIVGAAYFVVFFSDVNESISTQRQLLQTKNAELAEAENAKKAYNQDVAKKARKEAMLRKQQKILPDKAESHAFLSNIQTVATISGIKLTSWTPLDEVPEAYYAKVPMQLKLSGKFHQLAKFFHGIGQVDRIINMENIVVKVVEDKTKHRPANDGVPEVEETVTVDAECLATAFRASAGNEERKKRKRGGK